MIIAIEGISAAGKTTWASRYAPAIVDEITGCPPTNDIVAVAEYWSDRHGERWQRGLELERSHKVVCFDTDPLKVHYSWCLWQIGEGTRDGWIASCEATRERIEQKQLGFADRIFFLEPTETVVRRQRASDRTRSRRNFEIHVRLYEPLRCWYVLLESLSSGTVVFNAHQTQDPVSTHSRADRYDLQLFDALIDAADQATG